MRPAGSIRAPSDRLAPRTARSLKARLRSQHGFTLIELLAALTILVVGVLASLTAFAASDKLSLVNERHEAMAQVAQREIERVLGISYSQIGLDCGGTSGNTCPTQSSDPSNPDYYVDSTGGNLEFDRTGGSSEPLDIDAANGTIAPTTSWTQASSGGLLSGTIYDFVTWSTDPQCAPGCPTSQDYKRITVAVTMNNGILPNPVWISSVIVNPDAVPSSGTVNGTGGNPLSNPNVTCSTSGGTSQPCTNGLTSGTAYTYFLHDWAATNSGTPTPPSADNATHQTVGIASGKTCTSNQNQVTISADITGCPVPDLMDTNSPIGSTLYNYSTDQCPDSSNCYPGGRELQATGIGTGSATDCSGTSWGSGMSLNNYELWVTPALTSSLSLDGAGGLTIYTQTLNPTPSPAPTVSFCVQVYDIPPTGATAGSLADLIAYPPTAIGSAVGFVAPPASGSGTANWPSSATQVSFAFTFDSSSYTVPAGDRIGLLVWEKAKPSPAAPLALIYDNSSYLSQFQVNSG